LAIPEEMDRSAFMKAVAGDKELTGHGVEWLGQWTYAEEPVWQPLSKAA